ncbi:MAG: hypothetical protein AAGK97_00175 [Bacteroidota bacterium]
MKNHFTFILIILITACHSQKEITQATASSLTTIQQTFEEKALAGCPISKGPLAVIDHLEQMEGFHRNKDYDFGNGSVRFNALNTSMYGRKLVDEKSMFLLNYNVDNPSYEGWTLFHTIYWFENEQDQQNMLKDLLKMFDDTFKLTQTTQYDGLRNPYARYTLPNGTQFNFKHLNADGKYVIDLLWALKG